MLPKHAYDELTTFRHRCCSLRKQIVGSSKPVDYREHFRTKSIEELVEAYNRDRGTSGWVTARGFYITALNEALLATGLDCSSFIGSNSTLQPGQRVAFDGVQFVVIGTPIPTPEPDPPMQLDPMGGSHHAQFLIDALIRSMEWRNDAKIQEFGERLVAQWVGAQGTGEDGVFRPFGELEDSNFVVQGTPSLPGASGRVRSRRPLD